MCFAVIAGFAVVLLAIIPQIYFQYHRSENYNGSTFLYNGDEVYYASYLQFIIDGRPRKGNLVVGEEVPQGYETYFSIQFIPAYLVALFSKLFGVSADGSFIFLSVIFGFLSGLSVFFFFLKLTENPYYSLFGTLFLIVFGSAAAGISLLKEAFGLGPSPFYLTFLRRYVPLISFPFVFLLIYSVWAAMTAIVIRSIRINSVIASLSFCVIVYSYFYYWTGMLAWLLCVLCLLPICRGRDARKRIKLFVIPFLAITAVFCIPYCLMLLNRNALSDNSMLLEHTRTIVLLRPTVLVGIGIILSTLFFVWVKRLRLNQPTTLFVLSFGFLPLVVFNQQVLTGVAIQPYHYERYLVNYTNLAAVVIIIFELYRGRIHNMKSYIWVLFSLILFAWGVAEMHSSAKKFYWYGVERDNGSIVSKRLRQIANRGAHSKQAARTLNFDSIQGANQTTFASTDVLWAEHLPYLLGMSEVEKRQRYFINLYLQDKSEDWIEQRLENCPNEPCRVLIGQQVNRTLMINPPTTSHKTVNGLVAEYREFLKNINQRLIEQNKVSFVVVRERSKNSFEKLDMWYERYKEEKLGNYSIYFVRLRNHY